MIASSVAIHQSSRPKIRSLTEFRNNWVEAQEKQHHRHRERRNRRVKLDQPILVPGQHARPKSRGSLATPITSRSTR